MSFVFWGKVLREVGGDSLYRTERGRPSSPQLSHLVARAVTCDPCVANEILQHQTLNVEGMTQVAWSVNNSSCRLWQTHKSSVIIARIWWLRNTPPRRVAFQADYLQAGPWLGFLWFPVVTSSCQFCKVSNACAIAFLLELGKICLCNLHSKLQLVKQIPHDTHKSQEYRYLMGLSSSGT